MCDENNELTEENKSDCYNSVYQKTMDLMKETLARKKRLKKKSIKDVLVMGPASDPFYVGSPTDVIKAEWAYNLWKDYVETTGVNEVHVRGIHYYIVMKRIPVEPPTECQWKHYENTTNCSSYLGYCFEKARYLNLILPGGIIDQKNDVTRITIYEQHKTTYKEGVSINLPADIPSSFWIEFPKVYTPHGSFDNYMKRCAEDYARNLVNSSYLEKDGIEFNLDLVRPFYIEIWSEKTLPSFIHDIFRKLGVNKVIEGGELSLTTMYDFVNTLNRNEQDGVALYFSDYDPRGNDMPINMAQKIQWAKCVDKLNQNVYIQPIALSEEQIIQHNLPLAPIKMTGKKGYDTLKKKFTKRQTVKGFAELQALEGNPALYKQIVVDAIRPWRVSTSDIENVINESKQELIDEIKEMVFQEMETHKDELQKHYDKMVRLAKDVNDVLPDEQELEEKFKEANELVSNSYVQIGMINKLTNIKDGIKLPDVTPPKIKREPPVECLYDSRRDFEDQFEILFKNKITKQKI